MDRNFAPFRLQWVFSGCPGPSVDEFHLEWSIGRQVDDSLILDLEVRPGLTNGAQLGEERDDNR